MRRPGTSGPPPDGGAAPPPGALGGDAEGAPRGRAAPGVDPAGRGFPAWPLALLGGAVVLIVALILAVRLATPDVSEEDVRQRIWAVLQRETPQSFLITGALDITATARVTNTRRFLPGVLDLSLGTTSSQVRVPGRVSYGFDVRALDPSLIDVSDGLVEVTIPDLVVYSVEPNLADMEVETEEGWARMSATTEAVQQRALEIAQGALEGQGELHLARSTQPRVNTAMALERMLTPVVQAAGLASPRFRFRIGDRLVMEPGVGGRGN